MPKRNNTKIHNYGMPVFISPIFVPLLVKYDFEKKNSNEKTCDNKEMHVSNRTFNTERYIIINRFKDYILYLLVIFFIVRGHKRLFPCYL